LKELSLHNLKFLGLFNNPTSKGDVFEGPYEREDTEAWYPFNPIPNVRKFEVRVLGFDPIFAMFNIRKRFAPAIEFEKHVNNPMNRYMERQLIRLEACRKAGNSKLFFVISESLIKHSRVFFISQLNATYGR
jgi:hypothetical protein